MTNEEINKAIAEACGWVRFREEEYPNRMLWREGEVGSRVWDEPPDYCGDLNAMHEAEETLTEEQQDVFVRKLWDVIWIPVAVEYNPALPSLCGRIWMQVHSTPRQRAEAFLRTLGKWRDT